MYVLDGLGITSRVCQPMKGMLINSARRCSSRTDAGDASKCRFAA
jgi:hypothetical protein